MRGALISMVGAVALVVVGVLGGSSAFFPPTALRVDVEHGRAVFNRHCASCHSVSESGGSRRAPSLHRIGAEAADRVPGQDAEAYILTSIVRPEAYLVEGVDAVMPANIARGLSRSELVDVVAYLSTLGGSLRPSKLAALDWTVPEQSDGSGGRLSLASIERGRSLFLGKANCATCHQLRHGMPGSELMAPSLSLAGQMDRSDLEQALLDPSKHIVPGYETWMVSAGGLLHSGRLVEDDGPGDTIRLLAADPQGVPELLEFHPDELEELDDEGRKVVRVDTSRMPPVGDLLDRGELDALLDFLMIMR